MPNFKQFIKGFEEPEAKPEVKPEAEPKPQPEKYQGGIAKDMQTAGFEPYEVDEKKNLLRVKDKAGADYEISQGEGWSFNVAKDGKQIYRNVPNYMRFDTIVAGKPERGFDKYQIKEEQPQPKPAPKPGSFDKMIEGFDKKEARPLQAEQYHKPDDRGFEPKQAKTPSRQRKNEIPANFFDKPEDAAYDFFGRTFQKAEWGDNAYKTKNGEEWWIGTQEEANEAAKQEVKDLISDAGIESFSPEFQDWIYENAVSEQGMKQLREDYAEMFREMGQPDDAEWILKTDDNNLRAFIINSFPDTWQEEYERSGALDYDKIAEEALVWDEGPAHFIGRYDGKEYQLPNGFVAYRQN